MTLFPLSRRSCSGHSVSALKCQLAVGFFLVATMACGDAQLTDKALETLKARWKPTVAKEMPLTELDAPNGYVVLKEPAADAQEARRVDKAAKVKVKFYMDRGNRRFYMTEWNWNNAGKGGKFNWVMLNPVAEAPAKPEAGKLDALYNDLRHDQTQWNCENAYGEFGKIVNQPEVVEFLVAKLATEKDAQAKSCVVALLCTSSQYKHDATFARTVLDLLIEYQAKRSNGFHDKAGVPEPERLWLFVSSSGASLNCVWIRFLVRNTPKYEELLSPVMLDPKADFYLRWVCIHAMARHKLMEKYYPKLDPDFYRMLFENLRNDGHGWNAQFATRILVILKPVSTPYIIQRLNEPRLDDQEKDILNLINKDILLPANRGKFEFKYGNLNSSIFGTTADTNDKFDCELSMFKN